MLHQPTRREKQTVQTVIADLEAQRHRLADAVTWTKNVATGIEACGRQVHVTNVGPIEHQTREVGVAFHMSTGSFSQDILIFSLVCTPTEEEIAAMRREPALAGEAARLANLIQWQSQGIRTFETWLVPENTIWRGSAEETQAYFVAKTKEWLNYWFDPAPVPIFRPRMPTIHPVRLSGRGA